MRYQIAAAVIALAAVTIALGQELPPSTTPRIEVAKGAKRLLDVSRLRSLVVQLRQQAENYPWDPKAEALLNTAEKATPSVLRLDLTSARTRSIKRQPESGDVMTVVWDISSASIKGSLLLEDTPFVSQYLLSLHETSIEKLATILPDVLIWPYPMTAPLTIQTIEHHESLIGQINVHFVGAAMPRIHDYDVRGIGTRDGEWIIEVVIGKGKLRKYYGDTFGVPERVPPLSEIVSSWSDGKLVSELSNRTALNARDKIITAELVRREPSDAYLLQLVTRVAKNQMIQLNTFNQIILALYYSDPSGSKVRTFLEANLPGIEAMGPISDEMVHEGYRIVGCSESMEERAVKYLTEGRFLNAAFAYFSRCSTSTAAFRALEAARVPTQLDGLRQDALSAFRARIESKNPHDH